MSLPFRTQELKYDVLILTGKKTMEKRGEMRGYPSQNYAFITTAFGFVDLISNTPECISDISTLYFPLHRRVTGCPEKFSKHRKKIILS